METDWVVIVPCAEEGLSHVRLVPATLKVEEAVERVVRDLPPVDGRVWAFPMAEVIGFTVETRVVATRRDRLVSAVKGGG